MAKELPGQECCYKWYIYTYTCIMAKAVRRYKLIEVEERMEGEIRCNRENQEEGEKIVAGGG